MEGSEALEGLRTIALRLDENKRLEDYRLIARDMDAFLAGMQRSDCKESWKAPDASQMAEASGPAAEPAAGAVSEIAAATAPDAPDAPHAASDIAASVVEPVTEASSVLRVIFRNRTRLRSVFRCNIVPSASSDVAAVNLSMSAQLPSERE